jgi:hypothetical protein
LKSEGIIVESRNKIRLKYDIFEDICFERYIDKAFDACHGSYNVFFDEIEKIYNRSQEKYLDMGHLQVLILKNQLVQSEHWKELLAYLEK